MKIRNLLLVVILISGFFTLSYPQDNLAFATQCSGRSIQGNFDLAHIVFLGSVNSMQYFPFSDTIKVTFDVHHVFKGDNREKITINYELRQMFSERIAFVQDTSYVVMPESEKGQYNVRFCTPVFLAVTTIVDGFYELENDNNAVFGKLVPWELSEKLSNEDIKKAEEIQKTAFTIMQQNIGEKEQLEKNIVMIAVILLISAIIGTIITIVVIFWRKRRCKLETK